MSDAQQERYAAIERHYSQGQWQEVLSSSTALLSELPEQPGDPLRTRLTLLQGHTLLYGLGQVAEAAAIYRQVLDSQPEPVLQSIAQQELERCSEHIAAQQTGPDTAAAPQSQAAAAATSARGDVATGSDFPFTAEAVGSAAAGQQAAAMPWLDALGGVDPAAALAPQGNATQPPWLTTVAVEQPPQALEPEEQDAAVAPAATAEDIDVADVVDVIDEPEQIDVHQADPQRAEVVDLAPAATQERIEPVAVAEEQQSEAPKWSSAEEAELARGLLTVVLR